MYMRIPAKSDVVTSMVREKVGAREDHEAACNVDNGGPFSVGVTVTGHEFAKRGADPFVRSDDLRRHLRAYGSNIGTGYVDVQPSLGLAIQSLPPMSLQQQERAPVWSHEVAAVGLSNVHTALHTFQAPSVSNFSM